MSAKGREFAAFWRSLKTILMAAPSTATVFNQYRDCSELVDVPEAAAIRTENLRRFMADATETASILIVA